MFDGMDLSVCLVSTEFFGWGRYGGIGKTTRDIGAGLTERDVEVTVVVPRGEGQGVLEEVGGMRVHGFPMYAYPFTRRIYRECDADVYHSQEPSWGSIVALKAMPSRRHAVTCQNPRSKGDWDRVNRFYPLRRRVFNRFFGERFKETVRGMGGVYCQAQYIRPKVRELYGLKEEPRFLPNPVEVPKGRQRKADEPTVCFLGRFDGEKRPELFFELARRFPEVEFVALGASHDSARDASLRDQCQGIGNLEMPGFVEDPRKRETLEKSWILVNTSVSECLPVSFLEAAAHGCAILSFVDPDGFASRFGVHVEGLDLESGLLWLLEGDRWRELGERGRAYVSEVHEKERVIDLHVEAYEALLA
jgi:glycosyltransferase involved in cell wall biosynthesis